MIRETEFTTVSWLIGRGLSIACGLTWSVPAEWGDLERETKVDQIRNALRAEMDAAHVDSTPIQNFLDCLAKYTTEGWRHEFMTTNWDYLLQREIQKLGLKIRPTWMAESHVYHLNGTVELRPNHNEHGSPFLLEEDSAAVRHWTVEANVAYNRMIWRRVFVVVGMSFECATDRFLLSAIHRVEDGLPIGESQWLILNPDSRALDSARERISLALPSAHVETEDEGLESWLNCGLPQLQKVGAIAF